jgi:hypothetical protein
MWLPNYIINSNQNKPLANRGKISAADGQNVSVSTFIELRELPVVAPYGVAYCPPVSETSVVLPIADGNVCLGVFAQKKELLQKPVWHNPTVGRNRCAAYAGYAHKANTAVCRRRTGFNI